MLHCAAHKKRQHAAQEPSSLGIRFFPSPTESGRPQQQLLLMMPTCCHFGLLCCTLARCAERYDSCGGRGWRLGWWHWAGVFWKSPPFCFAIPGYRFLLSPHKIGLDPGAETSKINIWRSPALNHQLEKGLVVCFSGLIAAFLQWQAASTNWSFSKHSRMSARQSQLKLAGMFPEGETPDTALLPKAVGLTLPGN